MAEISKQTKNDPDTFAEKMVAEYYDVRHDNSQAWYDARNPRTGTKYEVKGAMRQVENPNRKVTGRFRLWEDAHRRIAGAEGANGQTAWYVFVLMEGATREPTPVKMRRMHPSTVTTLLSERSDDGTAWNRSGHASKGRQYKLPHTAVF